MAFGTYIRVSQVKGRSGDSYQTVDEQRRKIKETARLKGVSLGAEVVEEDVSGAKNVSERGLEDLIQMCERGELDGIIVAYQDRLSRGSLLEQAELWERLEKCNARFISGDGIDSALPGQELLFSIKAALAREQWKRYRENWDNTVRNAVDRGVHPGGANPNLGYDRDEETRMFVPNKIEKPLVVGLFERRVDGMSFPDLARWLGTKGYPYTAQAIRKIVKNRVYLGEARGAFGHVNTEAHEPLVSRLLFDKANAVRDTSLRRPRNGSVTGRVLCQGLVVCATCGWRMQPSLKKTRKDGTKPIAYQCANAQCDAKARIMWDMLDPYIDQRFRAYMESATIKVKAAGDPGRYNRALIAHEAAEYDRDLFLANTKALSLLGEDKWNKTAERYIAAVEEARLEVEAAKADMPDPDARILFAELWDSLSILERRNYLAKFVDRIVVQPVNGQYGVPVNKRMHIQWQRKWRKGLGNLEIKLAETHLAEAA